jgi:dipeptidyl aminopeptidase/acylaminoacyl peptidase
LTNLSPSISPDNNWIAFTTSPGWGSRKSNIYKTLIDGGAPTQLTFLNVNCYGPAWSPDGTRVAFNSDESGSRKIWIVDIGGGRPRQLAKTQIGGVPGHGFELSWAPGHSILYRAPEGKIKLLDPDTEEEKMLVKDDSFYAEGGPIYSPDGMRVAVNARGGIWVVSVKDNTGSLVIKEKASLVGWSPNGNSVFAAIKDQMMAIPLNGGNAKPLFTLPTPNILCVSPDGRRFIYSVSEAMSDIWLLSNIDPARRR